jgi:VWFA-related protein
VVFGFVIGAWCCIWLAQAQQTQPSQAPGQAGAGQVTGWQAATPGVTTLKITAREVLLDVLVTDKAGQPVTGLKAADFHASEEGEPQLIRRVDEHHPMSESDLNKLTALPALPTNTFSNFTPVRNTNASIVLLLDAMDSPIGAQMSMREQLINYLKHMQPGPQVAIFQLDTQMRLIQGFTSDPKVLLAAAESKRDMPSLARPTAAPQSYTADALYRRALSENLRAGMRMMGSYLAGYAGRKNLIWFTGRVPMTTMGGGFGNPFHDGVTVRGGLGDEVSDLTDVLTVSRVAVYPVDTRGLVAPGDASMMGMGRGMGRGPMMSATPNLSNQINMNLVADETGGKAYYNTNDLVKVIADVVNTGSSYYTVAYATTNTKWTGELRHIKITVDRPDVHLQHRAGYYAYSLEKKEQSELASLETKMTQGGAPPPAADTQSNDKVDSGAVGAGPQLGATVHHSTNGGFGAAMELGAIPPTEIVFDARIQVDSSAEKLGKGAPLPPDNFLQAEWQHKPFRNYTIFFNADAHRMRLTQTPDGLRHGIVDFVAVVYTQDGREVNSQKNTGKFQVTAAQYRELLTSGLPEKLEIAVPVKGSFFLRLGVRDLTGDQVGALEIPVDQIKIGVVPIGGQAP